MKFLPRFYAHKERSKENTKNCVQRNKFYAYFYLLKSHVVDNESFYA